MGPGPFIISVFPHHRFFQTSVYACLPHGVGTRRVLTQDSRGPIVMTAFTIAPADFANVSSVNTIKYQTWVGKMHNSPHFFIEPA